MMPPFSTKYSLHQIVMVSWLSAWISFARSVPALFQHNLSIRNLFVSNPYEADVTSSYNSTVIVVLVDEDYPNFQPVHCQIEWKAGVGPPDGTQHQCENATTRVWFPESTFYGVQRFQLQIAQSTIDASIGECPEYCYLTKYASVNITYPGTPNWACDPSTAICQQNINSTIKASVYLAVA